MTDSPTDEGSIMALTKVQQGVDLIDSMTDTELNQLIDYIRSSIKTRRDQRNAKARAALEVGSRVRITGKTKPQYLSGMTGKVTEFRNTRVTVQLDAGQLCEHLRPSRVSFLRVEGSAQARLADVEIRGIPERTQPVFVAGAHRAILTGIRLLG